MDIRPCRESDLATIVDLINCGAAADEIDCGTSILELGGWWDGCSIQLPRDGILAVQDGRPVGYAMLDRRPDPSGNQYSEFAVSGGVLPAFRRLGVGAALLAECEQRALRRLDDVARQRVSLMVWVNVRQVSLAALCRSRGFEVSRTFLTMEYKYSGLDTACPPPGYSIRLMSSVEAEPVKRVLEIAFHDHWGHPTMTLQEWRNWHPDPVLFPELTYVALAPDGSLAGVCHCIINEYQNRRLGTNRGWVEDLGVLRQHRGRGLGRALLMEGVAGLLSAGCTSVLLDVDAENPTGALHLYRSAGFRLYDEIVVWRKMLRC